MQGIGAAIVGTGFMGSVHAEALLRAGVPVVGVVGSSPAKSRRAAESLGIPRAYDTFEAVLADPAARSVHLATPNRLHFDQARRALLAGKHVLCEKPLAMDAAESAALVALARERPRQAAGVNYNVRSYPLCLEARDRARRGEIGTVRHVCGSYAQDWLLNDNDYNWRVLAEEGGELRAVADIGTHWLDLVQSVTGLEVEAVCADLLTVHPTRLRPPGEVETFSGTSPGALAADLVPVAVTTEDFGAVLLRFRGGARGCLWVSQVAAGRKNSLRFEVAGSQQSLAWNSERPEELWIGRRDAPNGLLLKDPALAGIAARSAMAYPAGHAEGYPDSFKQGFLAFYRYIAAGDFDAPPTFPTFAEGHREIVLCAAILRSHKERRWIDVEPEALS